MKRLDIYFLLIGLLVIFAGVMKENEIVPVIGFFVFLLGLAGLKMHLKRKEYVN